MVIQINFKVQDDILEGRRGTNGRALECIHNLVFLLKRHSRRNIEECEYNFIFDNSYIAIIILFSGFKILHN